jgi:hypothetical protein
LAKSIRTEAEEKYAKAQQRARETAKAMTEVEAEAKRIADNTARLKALRLAKEAADAAHAAVNPPAAKTRATKPKAKTAVK